MRICVGYNISADSSEFSEIKELGTAIEGYYYSTQFAFDDDEQNQRVHFFLFNLNAVTQVLKPPFIIVISITNISTEIYNFNPH